MTMKSLRISLSVSLLLFLFGCGPEPSKRVGEPNDRIGDAGFLPDGKAIEMRIDSSGDRDWYGFRMPSAGYIQVKVKDVPKDLDLQVRFADRLSWEKEDHEWRGEWEELPASHAVHDQDTVHFVVRDAEKGMSKDTFKLKAEFLEAIDPHEPNDEMDEAGKLELGARCTSYVFPKGDRDLFKVKADTQGYLFVEPRQVPEDIDAEARFLKRVRMSGEMVPISGYRRLPAAAFVRGSGEYYVEIGDEDNEGSSREPLHWDLSFIEEMDSTEPNARWQDAHPVRLSDTVELALFPVGDRDLLQLRIGGEGVTEGKVRVSTQGVGELSLQMKTVREMEGGRRSDLTEWRNPPATFEFWDKDVLMIRGREDRDARAEPYKLLLELQVPSRDKAIP